MTNRRILSTVAIAAFTGAIVLTPVASRASTASPAEQAATAELNRSILAANAAAEARSKALEAQYQEQMRQQASQYEEQKKQWEQQLQQQYLAQQQSNEANRDR
jgi:hypothetical protein